MGCNHVAENLLVSLRPSILTFPFDLILGSFSAIWVPNGLFLLSRQCSKTVLRSPHIDYKHNFAFNITPTMRIKKKHYKQDNFQSSKNCKRRAIVFVSSSANLVLRHVRFLSEKNYCLQQISVCLRQSKLSQSQFCFKLIFDFLTPN